MDISFNRLLHWIEETKQGIFLVQYDLEGMDSVALHSDLRFTTFAQNIEQNCIYTVFVDDTRGIDISSVSLQEDNDNLCVSGLSLNPQGQFISICLT